MNTVIRTQIGVNRALTRPRSDGGVRCHSSGSSTFLRDPDREERGQHADQEHAAPPPDRHDDEVDRGRQTVADRPRALDERERLAAMARRKRLGNQRHAGGPLAPHPEAEQDAEHGELRDHLRQPARRREDQVNQHRRHQRALPADAVGDDAKGHAARRRRQQRQRGQELSRYRGRQLQCWVLDERRQDQRVEHDVERVEHPAQRGRDERPPCPDVGVVPPRQRSLGRRGERAALRRGECRGGRHGVRILLAVVLRSRRNPFRRIRVPGFG